MWKPIGPQECRNRRFPRPLREAAGEGMKEGLSNVRAAVEPGDEDDCAPKQFSLIRRSAANATSVRELYPRQIGSNGDECLIL